MMLRRPSQQGFSLVEFLVVSLIGLLLMLAIGRIYSASQAAMALTQAKSRMQDNARLALETIERDIRMAGYMGCSNDGARLRNQEIFVNLPGAADNRSFVGVDFSDNFSRSIEGFEAVGTSPGQLADLNATTAQNWQPALPAALNGLVARGSDVLVVRYLGPDRSQILSATPVSGGSAIELPEGHRLGTIIANRTYAIADCSKVSFFTAGNVASDGRSFRANGLTGAEIYTPDTAYIYEVTAAAYYVGVTNEGTGLFRMEMGRNALPPTEVLVPNVNSLQALYAWDTADPLPDGSVDREGHAQTLASSLVNGETVYSRIGMVRLGLLLEEGGIRRANADTDPNRVQTVLGTNITPVTSEEDRVLGVFETSTASRNHLFGY